MRRGEEQVAPGRHVEGVHHQDGDQQDGQGVDDRRDARRRRAHLVEEPDAGGDGADGHHDLHPPRRPGPGDVREGRAGRDEHHGADRRRPGDLLAGRRRRRSPPAPRPGRPPAAGRSPRALPVGWPGGRRRRRSRRLGPAPRHGRAGASTARARRRPAPRRSATAPRTGPEGSRGPRRTGAPPSRSPTTVPRAPSATARRRRGPRGVPP